MSRRWLEMGNRMRQQDDDDPILNHGTNLSQSSQQICAVVNINVRANLEQFKINTMMDFDKSKSRNLTKLNSEISQMSFVESSRFVLIFFLFYSRPSFPSPSLSQPPSVPLDRPRRTPRTRKRDPEQICVAQGFVRRRFFCRWG